jgi:hypothetical protein
VTGAEEETLENEEDRLFAPKKQEFEFSRHRSPAVTER